MHYEVAVMLEYPFLALAKRQTAALQYNREIKSGGKYATVKHTVSTVRPDGMAFISDANFLTWVVSELYKQIHETRFRQGELSLSIKQSDLLHYIGRKPGGNQSALVAESFDRLKTTYVETNLPFEMTKGQIYKFHLLENCSSDNTRPTDPIWTIIPPKWLINVVKSKLVVSIDPESMKLEGIARCVYRYARARIADGSIILDPEILDPSRAADRFGAIGKGRVRSMRFKLKKLVAALNGETASTSTYPQSKSRKSPPRIPGYTIANAKSDGIAISPIEPTR